MRPAYVSIVRPPGSSIGLPQSRPTCTSARGESSPKSRISGRSPRDVLRRLEDDVWCRRRARYFIDPYQPLRNVESTTSMCITRSPAFRAGLMSVAHRRRQMDRNSRCHVRHSFDYINNRLIYESNLTTSDLTKGLQGVLAPILGSAYSTSSRVNTETGIGQPFASIMY